MATPQYFQWVNGGRKWSLARPIADMVAYAKEHGIPVLGTIGNEAHLTANYPEDHTPFSYTAYPVPAQGWVCACDLANLKGIGDAVLRDARLGLTPWLKYMNYAGRQYTHQDKFVRPAPNDDQHLHLSCFSNQLQTSITGYDPLATLAPTEDDDMPAGIGPIQLPNAPQVMQSYSIPPVNAGALPWGPAWISLFGDLYGQKAAFRMAVSDGNGGWQLLGEPQGPDQDPLVIVESGIVWNTQLSGGARGFSAQRVPVTPDDPCTLVVSACVEYGIRR